MKIFVTGATGVFGRRAVAQLLAAGAEVTGVARTAQKAAVAGPRRHPVQVSLFDREALAQRSPGTTWSATSPRRSRPASRRHGPCLGGERQDPREGSRNLVDAALARRRRPLRPGIHHAPLRRRWRRLLDESAPVDPTRVTEPALVAEAEAARFAEHGGVGVALRFGTLLRVRQRPHGGDHRGRAAGVFAVPGTGGRLLAVGDDRRRGISGRRRARRAERHLQRRRGPPPDAGRELPTALAAALGTGAAEPDDRWTATFHRSFA